MKDKKKILVGASILALITGTIYFYTQYQKSQQQLESIKKDPSKIVTIETGELIKKVGKLIVLPKETPTVATVNIGQDQNSKKTVKVALYNGTKTVGLTYTVEKKYGF